MSALLIYQLSSGEQLNVHKLRTATKGLWFDSYDKEVGVKRQMSWACIIETFSQCVCVCVAGRHLSLNIDRYWPGQHLSAEVLTAASAGPLAAIRFFISLCSLCCFIMYFSLSRSAHYVPQQQSSRRACEWVRVGPSVWCVRALLIVFPVLTRGQTAWKEEKFKLNSSTNKLHQRLTCYSVRRACSINTTLSRWQASASAWADDPWTSNLDPPAAVTTNETCTVC